MEMQGLPKSIYFSLSKIYPQNAFALNFSAFKLNTGKK